MSRFVNANARLSVANSEADNLAASEQVETKQIGEQSEGEKSELRLAQLQQQLPSNEPGALMHLVEGVSGEDEEDQDTRDCKKLFKNMKFFLSREVRSIFSDDFNYIGIYLQINFCQNSRKFRHTLVFDLCFILFIFNLLYKE